MHYVFIFGVILYFGGGIELWDGYSYVKDMAGEDFYSSLFNFLSHQ